MKIMPSITPPGSKSITNRALLLAALASGESILNNVLFCHDTVVMIEALKKMGVKIEQHAQTLKIKSDGNLNNPKEPLFLKNAGTAVRFLTAILAHQNFTTCIEGDEQMQKRPIQDLIDALAQLGVAIESNAGCPPLKIHGKPIEKGSVRIKGTSSSQYTSALLMLAPLLPESMTLEIDGHLVSKPYIDITLKVMKDFGIKTIERKGYERFTIPRQTYKPQTITIEPDASSASYFFGLAAITGTTIRVDHISPRSIQPDIHILHHLEKMGCKVKSDSIGIEISGPSKLKPLGRIDANDFPDGAMTLAVVAAFAEGTTELTGLENLRIKECDRLNALHTELKKMNVSVEEKPHGLVIHGNPLNMTGAQIHTYGDHRIAMCFGMAGCRIEGIKIEDPNCVGKTYPHFWKDLKSVHTTSPYPILLY